MMNKLDDAFRFQQQALGLLSRRQEVLASNIANADTPGYQARDIDFSQQLKNALGNKPASGPVTMALTSSKHMQGKKCLLMMLSCYIAYRISQVLMVTPWIWTASELISRITP